MINKNEESIQTLDKTLSQIVDQGWKYNDYEYPKVSIIIPTFNCPEKISVTIESLLDQRYPNFEIIIVDAGSTDRTLEVIKSYRDDRLNIYSVSGYQRYVLLNKGISQSTGEYVNCLFPGDYYIYNYTLHHMMELALENNKPDLLFCGTLLRDGKNDPKILLRPLSLNLLKRGQQPTSLQSCWFRASTVRMLGKFNPKYTLRGGYELMCRFSSKRLRAICTQRVFIDYDLRLVTRDMVFRHFMETIKTIWKYYGFIAAVRWLFTQKDFSRLLKIWLRTLRVALIGR